LKKELQRIKEDFAEQYKSYHALKLPPHITLIPSFKIPVENEVSLISQLEEVSNKEKPFIVELSGYGSFKPRVIYINIKNPTPVKEVFYRIKNVIQELSKEISEKKEGIHPHITIATRDLSRENFKKAWQLYRNRPFNPKFEVKELVLFSHNGRHWEKVPGSFSFKSKDSQK